MNAERIKPGAGSFLKRFRFALIGVLITVMLLLSVEAMRQESLTFDEPLDLTTGYSFWLGDYRLQEDSGALPQRWFALPLLVSKPNFPSREDAQWRQPGSLAQVPIDKFMFGSGNPTERMVFWGRLMALVMDLAAALAVYYWAARVFGVMAGLVACFFCALDPTMLAHGHLMTSDVTAALFFLMSVGCFWSLLRRFTCWRLAASTACFGLLLASKMSAGLAILMAITMLASRIALGRPWPVRKGVKL